MFECRDYFGELLSVAELTALSVVNLKVQKDKEMFQGLCVENMFNSALHCGFLILVRGPETFGPICCHCLIIPHFFYSFLFIRHSE